MEDPWHYGRIDEAHRIVDTLKVGLVSALAIIEPRRRGKTTFLREDLEPVAAAAGLVPIYINLAATTGPLEGFIAAAIEYALRGRRGALGALRALGRTRVRKVAGKAGVASAEVSAELETADTAAGSLAAAFDEVQRLDRQAIFLLDEVHRLGEPAADAVAWSLRSLLDTHRKRVKVVATSSSAASYELFVTGERRAFNRWFTRTTIEPLAAGFVAHLARVASRHFPRHGITPAELSTAYEALGQSPKFLRDYLNLRLLNPALDAARCLAQATHDAAAESGYEDNFTRLTPLQKVVLVAVALGQKELFAEATLAATGSVLRGQAISKSLMQKAVRALAINGWIIRGGRGDYALADRLFGRWLDEQMRAGRLPPPG